MLSAAVFRRRVRLGSRAAAGRLTGSDTRFDHSERFDHFDHSEWSTVKREAAAKPVRRDVVKTDKNGQTWIKYGQKEETDRPVRREAERRSAAISGWRD